MISKSAIAALTLALSATAFSASANDQFALSLGVTPGVYSTAELIQLRDAREDNDRAQIRFLEQRGVAASRGVDAAMVGSDAVITAYENALDGDGGNDENLDHFVAKVTGTLSVSAETVAFAQAHLARGLEDS